MAHKRKDTLVPSPEWWRHLRPYNKRKVAKAERRVSKKQITEVLSENENNSDK